VLGEGEDGKGSGFEIVIVFGKKVECKVLKRGSVAVHESAEDEIGQDWVL
jgi:hypothetical protein